jgi:hypothetical protein
VKKFHVEVHNTLVEGEAPSSTSVHSGRRPVYTADEIGFLHPFSSVAVSVVDRYRFDADQDPDDADAHADPTRSFNVLKNQNCFFYFQSQDC